MVDYYLVPQGTVYVIIFKYSDIFIMFPHSFNPSRFYIISTNSTCNGYGRVKGIV